MGTHEVRFTKEQFEARMEKIKSRYKPTGRRNISSCKHWLSGLLKCSICGASLAYGYNTHSPGFQCYKYMKGQHQCSHFISEKKVIAAVYEYFDKLLDGMDFQYEYLPSNRDAHINELDNLHNELKKIDGREARIRLAFENEVDTLEEYKENKERLKKARAELEKQIENLECETNDNKPSKEDVLTRARTVYDIIKDQEIDYTTKGTVMRSLVEDIIFDKKNGQLIFHLYIS